MVVKHDDNDNDHRGSHCLLLVTTAILGQETDFSGGQQAVGLGLVLAEGKS